MIKSSAMDSIHVIHVWIRNSLGLLIVIGIALFFWFRSGIHIEGLKVGHYQVKKLYIKLDKKLTLKADDIVIPISKQKPSFENVDKTFDRIKSLLTYFEYLEIQNIHFNDNTLGVIFADDILYITTNEYEIAGNIHRAGKRFIANIDLLYLKKNHATLNGKMTYDLKKDTLETEGRFHAYHIKGDFKASKEKSQIDFSIRSDQFADLKTFIDTLPLGNVTKSWIVEKVQATKYRLISFEGKADIGKKGNVKIDFDALKGLMQLDDVKIFYKEGLDPVLAQQVMLSYADGALHFDLQKPLYHDRILDGSTVDIVDLTGTKPTLLKLDLHFLTPFDEVVHQILHAYGLNIPVSQNKGKMQAVFKADIGLKDHNSSFNADVMLGEGDVNVSGVNLSVVSGEVHYRKDTVTLDKVVLKERRYEGVVDGKIRLNKKNAALTLNAKTIKIGDEKEPFLVLKNEKLPFELDFKGRFKAVIPKLKVSLENKADKTVLRLEDLLKIKPYLQDKGIVENGGMLEFQTKDFDTYSFKGELKRESCFFYDNDNVCHVRVPCSGEIGKNGIDIYAFDKRFHYNEEKSRIDISDINIDLKKFLDSRLQKNKDKVEKLVIVGKRSNFRYDVYTLLTDSYDIEVRPNGSLKAIGSLNGDIVKLEKEGNSLRMDAFRIQDKMLHPLIHFDGLKEGRYTLRHWGDPDNQMEGRIIIEGGVMSNFKAYNNTLAFLNTLPALATLNTPGFSIQGFKINEGVIEYHIIKDILYFDSVLIKGQSATIAGKGMIDMKQKTIQIELAIQTARELGKILEKVPLLGYILMGKDQSMTIGLKISGTLDDPKIRTTATEDILMMPIQFLKRTIEAPVESIKAK